MTTSGPYQSQLFNWVSRRSHRWQDRASQSLRQVKVAVRWGAQLLLYPIYLLLQTQLGAKLRAGQDWQLLEGAAVNLADEAALLAVDAPIQTVLQAIQICWDEESLISEGQAPETTAGCVNPAGDLATFRKSQPPAKSAALAATQKLRGIATQLNSRTLVLVTAANQVLEILTPEQQQYLQQQIVEELTRYGTQRRSPVQPSLSALQTPPQISPLRRRWQQLRVWFQTKVIPASALILRRDANLKPQVSLMPGTMLPNSTRFGLTISPQVLARIDRAFVVLEQYFQPSLRVRQTPQPQPRGLLRRLSVQLRHMFKPQELPGETALQLSSSSGANWRLRQLIQAAIDYFWGRSFLRTSVLSGLPGAVAIQSDDSCFNSTSLPSTGLVPESGQAWLTWSDVFGAHPAGIRVDDQVSRRSSLGSSASTRRQKADPKPAPGSIPAAEIESKATEIDTEAVFMGYEKHPLEQILQWLDQGLAWLERQMRMILINLWSFIQGFFGFGKKPEPKPSAPAGVIEMMSK